MTALLEQLQIDPHAPLPIAAQIQEQIRWLIASGKLNPGDRLPPIRELAERLGVHMHTIRFAYQRLETEGLVTMHRGRGTLVRAYDPKRLGSTGGNIRSHTIGVILPDFNPFYLPLIRGIDDACRGIPALPFLSNTHDNPLLAETIFHQMLAQNTDGLILVSTGFDWLAPGSSFPPVVYVDEPGVQKNVIQFDSEGAGYCATQHLIEHAYHDIALVTAPLVIPQAQAVYRGYRNALEDAGLPVLQEWILEVEDFKPESAYHAVQQLLSEWKKPQAIFAIADNLALGVLQAIHAAGLQVPEDIALVGYNDVEFAALLNPPLTTVALPAYQAGVRAVKSLLELQAGNEVSPPEVTLETRLVIRQSCGCTGDQPELPARPAPLL